MFESFAKIYTNVLRFERVSTAVTQLRAPLRERCNDAKTIDSVLSYEIINFLSYDESGFCISNLGTSGEITIMINIYTLYQILLPRV